MIIGALEQPHAVDTLTAASLRFRSGRCRQMPVTRNVRTQSEGYRDSREGSPLPTQNRRSPIGENNLLYRTRSLTEAIVVSDRLNF